MSALFNDATATIIEARLKEGYTSDEIIEAFGHEYSSDVAWWIRGIEGFCYGGKCSVEFTTHDTERWTRGWEFASRRAEAINGL